MPMTLAAGFTSSHQTSARTGTARAVSISLGIGGFGFSGCCSAFGSGVGVGVPVGQPTPAEVSDQFLASAVIPSPPDYATNWSQYHVEVSTGSQAMNIAAPHPAG